MPFHDLTMLNFCLAVRGMRGSRGGGVGGSGRSLSATTPCCSLASALASLHPMVLSRSARDQPPTLSHEPQEYPRQHPRPRSPTPASSSSSRRRSTASPCRKFAFFTFGVSLSPLGHSHFVFYASESRFLSHVNIRENGLSVGCFRHLREVAAAGVEAAWGGGRVVAEARSLR